jgi:hypothetical protein
MSKFYDDWELHNVHKQKHEQKSLYILSFFELG